MAQSNKEAEGVSSLGGMAMEEEEDLLSKLSMPVFVAAVITVMTYFLLSGVIFNPWFLVFMSAMLIYQIAKVSRSKSNIDLNSDAAFQGVRSHSELACAYRESKGTVTSLIG